MRSRFPWISATLALLCSSSAYAQGRSVAITVDDLPFAGGAPATLHLPEVQAAAESVNRKLLAAFRAHHVPVTGFVIQKSVESPGAAPGTRILREWIQQGLDPGNHTWSHSDINDLSPEQIEEEILRGESSIGPLMKEAGKKLEFFRFPMNHTGNTKVQHDAVSVYLSKRGYRVATCTIDNSDYLFNHAYVRMLAKNDEATAQKLRVEYLAYTSAEIDYYAALNKQVLGYEPPQVMLLHDNRLNADVIDQVLTLFERKRYTFVSLDAAQADAAYRVPDTFITEFGPMWG
ncbi:MAG: polysaccharide deacetylase family protein [Acidobacteriota bacterium]